MTTRDLRLATTWLQDFAVNGENSFDRIRRHQTVAYWDRLVAMGLLECIKSEKGRRHDAYRITDNGRSLIELS